LKGRAVSRIPRGARHFFFVVSGFANWIPITCIFRPFAIRIGASPVGPQTRRVVTGGSEGVRRRQCAPDDRRAVIPRTPLRSAHLLLPQTQDRQPWYARAFEAFLTRSGVESPGGDASARRRDVLGPRSGGAFASAEDASRASSPRPRPGLSVPPPPPSTSQEAVFPEALKSLKEADPDVYALVQKEKLRQMCVQSRADPIDPDAPARSDRRLLFR
jgi:hypothetical protein